MPAIFATVRATSAASTSAAPARERAGAGEVEHGDRLVGQEAVGDVAGGERGGGLERAGGEPDLVVLLVARREAAQDRDGVRDGRLAHEHRREAALERGVLLDVLAVLVVRRRADARELAAGERALSSFAASWGPSPVAPAPMSVWISSMKTTTRPAARRTSSLMPRSFSENEPRSCVPATTLAMSISTTTRSARALEEPLRDPLDDGGLADAGLADEERVVRAPLPEDVDRLLDLAARGRRAGRACRRRRAR